jgi:hypothetical protein
MKKLISISILLLTMLGLISTSEAYTQKRAYTFSTNCKQTIVSSYNAGSTASFKSYDRGKSIFNIERNQYAPDIQVVLDCKLPNDYMYSGTPQTWQIHQSNYTLITFQHLQRSQCGYLQAKICQNNYWGGENCGNYTQFDGTGTVSITDFTNLNGGTGAPFLRITGKLEGACGMSEQLDFLFSTYIVSRTI